MQSNNVLEISTTKNTVEIITLMLTLMRSYFLLGYLDKSPRVPEGQRTNWRHTLRTEQFDPLQQPV